MIEFISGLFVGMLWYEILCFFLLLFLYFGCLSREAGAGVFLVFIMILINPNIEISDFSFLEITLFVVGYLLAGFLWSLFKWRKHVINTIATTDVERRPPRQTSNEYLKERIGYGWNYDRLTHWIFAWPFSLANYFVGEMIVDILRKAKYFYEKIEDRNLPENIPAEKPLETNP